MELQTGDLLFKDTSNNTFASAIKDVTLSTEKYSFSHVGILFFEEGEWKVLEAIPKVGVRISPLGSFLSPAKGEEVKVVVGRLKSDYPFDAEKLISFGKKQLGKKYDDIFNWSDTRFYCSELVCKMFIHAGQDKAFIPEPMTFKEQGKETFHPTWLRYYENLGVPIPEGHLGINPNGMAKSKAVKLLFNFPLK